MQVFVRTIGPTMLFLFSTACGGSTTPAKSETHPERATEATQTAESSDEGGEPEHAEQPSDADKAKSDDADNAVSEESSWTPDNAQAMVERARHKLGRRCDAGSQAACRAVPDLDKCLNLQRQSCANVGDLFARGAAGLDKNPEQARDFWWRACDIASADCVRYGKQLFDMEALDASDTVADRFFKLACARDFQLCEGVGRFYQEKQKLAQARKFFDLGCAGGQKAACQAKQ